MNSHTTIFANDSESERTTPGDTDVPEAPECWSLEDFSDLFGGQR